MAINAEVFPPNLFDDIQEAGLKTIVRDYRVILREACKASGIEIGDAIVVYFKKTNFKNKNLSKEELEEIHEAGTRTIQQLYRIGLRDIAVMNDLEIGDMIVIYFKKTNIKNKHKEHETE